MLSPENGPTSRPGSGDGSKSAASGFMRRRRPSDKLVQSPGKPILGLPTAAQVAPFTLQRSLSGRMRSERNGPEDSEGEARKPKTSFGASGRWGASQRAEERAALLEAAYSIPTNEAEREDDDEKTNLTEAIRLAALVVRLQKIQAIDRGMLGCVVPSLVLMVVSEHMEQGMTRLVVEAVNSAITCVLLGQLVRYHLLNKKMALSTMVASDQVKKKRMVVKARIAVAFVFEAVILAAHPLPGIEMPQEVVRAGVRAPNPNPAPTPTPNPNPNPNPNQACCRATSRACTRARSATSTCRASPPSRTRGWSTRRRVGSTSRSAACCSRLG